MRLQDDTSDPKTYKSVFSDQVLKTKAITQVDKPIRYKHNGKVTIVPSTSPIYKVIKWYGEYEEDV